MRGGWFVTFLLALTLSAIGASVAAADKRLRVLAWPGYADSDLVKAFEQSTGSRVEVSIVDNDAQLWERVNQNDGGDFDVFAVNTAELQRYLDKGLVAPIDESAIPNIAHQLPRFRDIAEVPGLTRGGRRQAVPYTYAEMGLIYDPGQVDAPPTSIASLWDPRYRGKVLLYNGGSHNFSLAAQILGNRNVFQLQQSQWSDAVNQLIDMRRNAGAYYTQPEESAALFRQKHAAIMFANYGSQQIKLLKSSGIDVGYAIPKEGALAWLDCWVIVGRARDIPLAHQWIDFMLGPAAGQALLERQGLANTTSPSPFVADSDHIIWLEPVENVSRRELLWERIMAGYRASKVLVQ
ncbi:Family 1 extracellular solute-binding protein [Magnetospirillum sp. LM-5]|uniref:extracellular solute-binding protein n=1 Tax=Magnetospirillum sp. LM-5 TaxID=2681466 RepID=UPI00137E1367|nr:extracellular solute-binding protein [Magnetospirillum sp. LM-5]CAA7614348.1 Family 1 extracellular solute-binding protein [Magnetospirillum sp. LM-5]